MEFQRFIGIDYSGRGTPQTRTPALQVYEARTRGDPQPVRPASINDRPPRHWSRETVAEWLMDVIRSGPLAIVGIDHGFSFPIRYFERYQLRDWPQFLEDFCQHWPTDEHGRTVDQIRERTPARIGQAHEYRLTERWTSSAKSVFLFDVQGSVAKSTHTGLPWLRRIRQTVGSHVHFWPFDGWIPKPHRSVVCEVYPSLVRNRYPHGNRSPDAQDAYALAHWLKDLAAHGFLDRYFNPPLTSAERAIADLEGWIFGVS